MSQGWHTESIRTFINFYWNSQSPVILIQNPRNVTYTNRRTSPHYLKVTLIISPYLSYKFIDYRFLFQAKNFNQLCSFNCEPSSIFPPFSMWYQKACALKRSSWNLWSMCHGCTHINFFSLQKLAFFTRVWNLSFRTASVKLLSFRTVSLKLLLLRSYNQKWCLDYKLISRHLATSLEHCIRCGHIYCQQISFQTLKTLQRLLY